MKRTQARYQHLTGRFSVLHRSGRPSYAGQIYAEYQGEVAVYSILDGRLLAGSLPSKKQKLIVAWIEIHHEDLLADWELAVQGRQLFRIRGLDQ